MKIRRFLGVSVFVPVLLIAFVAASAAYGGNGKVLILGPSVVGAPSAPEQAAIAAGRAVDVVDATTWSGMTTGQFAAYDAIVIDDGECGSADPGRGRQSAALANVATWSAALTGNVYVTTQDATYHIAYGANVPGADATLSAAIRYSLGNAGHTGAYLSISCGYSVGLLNSLSSSGSFATTGGGGNNVHIVASPAPTELAGLTDSDLSNWRSSWHQSFTAYPADFTVFAVAVGGGNNPITLTRGSSSESTQPRQGYCSVAGNTHSFTGTPYVPGTFLDLAAGQVDLDANYKGAVPANFLQGLGISCDVPAGYVKTGETVGYFGAGDPGSYMYYKKA